MRQTIKKIIFAALFAALWLFAAACRQLDVVGNGSVTSFNAVLNAVPEQVQADEWNAGWAISVPDKTARFIWSGDWSKSPLYDVMLELDAEPFLKAGLDPERLPENYVYNGNTLIIGTKLGGNALQYDGDPTPLAAYGQIVSLKREIIGYHMSLDHYGVSLGGGNMFEWAKDMSANDKDIVFVLNPEPVIAAGADPNAVDGWILATVEAMDENGKKIEADKLLKIFNLQ